MDQERVEEIAQRMVREGYAAIICRLPQHVVMLTGYQPILGNTFCVVSLSQARQVELRLAVPEDERDLVPVGAAAEVITYTEETLRFVSTTLPAVRVPLADLLRRAGVPGDAVVGYEGGRSPVATAYTQVGVPGPMTLDLLRELLPGARLRDATDALEDLAAVKTSTELERILRAEAVAVHGFRAARESIRVGATEADVAAAATAALLRAGYAVPDARQVLAYAHVMAGPRAALAYRAFNLTSNATIQRGDTVLVQIEVCVNGYWAELTRTFFAGEVSEEWARAHRACIAGQDAALYALRAGATGREVDEAARNVMRAAGFDEAFRHGLGHGLGFQAINHAAAPILHPASASALRAGMVHNMEPAVYLEGRGGMRLNDNVAVRQDGNELLSAELPRELDWLVVEQ